MAEILALSSQYPLRTAEYVAPYKEDIPGIPAILEREWTTIKDAAMLYGSTSVAEGSPAGFTSLLSSCML